VTTETLTDAELVERLAHLPVERDTAEHYRGYLRRELVCNRCADCGHWHHPMRPMCPACWSWNVVPAPVSGRGTVHLFIALHQGPPADGVDYAQGPHPVVTVELEEQEGLRFTATLVDCALDEIHIGMPVELTWIERNGQPYPAFRPAGAPSSAAKAGA
jgi:uncharacterized OB-fold protein